MLTLYVTLLVVTPDERVVGRLALASPMFDANDEERASATLTLPKWEWVQLLWTLSHAPQVFLQVAIRNEALATA